MTGLSVDIPVLETQDLILRAPGPQDAESWIAYYATDRSSMNGGPQDRATAWRSFASGLGHWLIRGYGLFAVEERATSALVGRVGLWFPEGWPEPEIGWQIYDGFEGRGYAYQAAMAARRDARDRLGLGPLISLINHENIRSRRLAERMGAVVERDGDVMGKPALIYRHPKEAA